MKRTINEIWTMARLAVAYVIAFVGIVVGIPGRLLTDIANWLVRSAGCVGEIPTTDLIFGKFEKP